MEIKSDSVSQRRHSPKSVKPPRSNAHYYNMRHPHRGRAIIFNHFKFDSVQYRGPRFYRYGTEVDRERLRKTFLQLNFEVEIHNDLTRHQIGLKLKDAAERDYQNSDCIVIVVLSHGDDGLLAARDRNYEVEELFDAFLDTKSLVGKPKLVFIQACRGNGLDSGIEMIPETSVSLPGDMVDSKVEERPQIFRIPTEEQPHRSQTTSNTEERSQCSRTTSNTEERPQCSRTTTNTAVEPKYFRIPFMADLLVMYATCQGYFAWRHGEHGSYFIQALCDELDKNGTKEDLLHLLTNASRRVAFTFQSDVPNSRRHEKKQMPSIVSMLTLNLNFMRGGMNLESVQETIVEMCAGRPSRSRRPILASADSTLRPAHSSNVIESKISKSFSGLLTSCRRIFNRWFPRRYFTPINSTEN